MISKQRQITWRDVERVLTRLGYVRHDVKGSHRVYRHEHALMVVLPYRRMNSAVSELHLTAVQSTLANSGLLPPREFNAMLLNGSN
jgi:predicted RNA binding protein YcfA (HicA-like mRNA interferase family)